MNEDGKIIAEVVKVSLDECGEEMRRKQLAVKMKCEFLEK